MLPWIQAWRSAVPAFYEHHRPAAHFRTATHEATAVADALACLVEHVARELDAADGEEPLDIVDVGGGDGELLLALMARLDANDPALAARCRPVVVELRPRPVGLSDRIGWVTGGAPQSVPRGLRGLLVAHELLDDVPLDVLTIDDAARLRTVLVDPATGEESIGGDPENGVEDWCTRWWPATTPGERVEAGATRDHLWTELTTRLDQGIAVAVDYAHTTAERADGRWAAGTLTGYRDGRQVAPVPDGSMNLTAHVALDACAEAAAEAAHDRGVASTHRLVGQRDALRALLPQPTTPDPTTTPQQPSPQERLAALATTSRYAEAVDPAGLGAFTWLVQCFGLALPASMR